MDYTEFLFSQLLREFSSRYNELPYDEMFTAHTSIFIEYEQSSQSKQNKSEYDCICDFLNQKLTNQDLMF